jgi:hypothetical protein
MGCIRGIAGGGLLMGLAIWLPFGILGSAAANQESAHDHVPSRAHTPNGEPCAGQELTLKVNGQAGSPVVPYGPITIQGVLHCGTVPIRNAQVAVASVGYVPDAPAIASSVVTGLDGSFAYTVPPGPNRVLSFSYTSYSDDPGPSVSTTATLRVRPVLELEITPSKVRNYHKIYWTVTVLGGPFPPQGITLDMQVHLEGRWRTFDEAVIHQEGTSRRFYWWRFRRTFRPSTYAFRVSLPATGSGEYPYTSGPSNVVKIHVTPPV